MDVPAPDTPATSSRSTPEAPNAVAAETPAPVGRGPSPWPLLAAVAAVVVLFDAAVQPLLDVDSYWHVLVGRQILDGVPIRAAGEGWSFAPVPDVWVSTQWLTEVILALLERGLGFTGLLLWRLLTTALALATLWWATTRWAGPARSAVPFVLGSVALAFVAQERSQQVTLVLAPVLGWALVRGLRAGVLPHWWVVLPVTVVWANLHGGWVLVPFTLGLVAAGRWLDHGRHDVVARRAALLALLATASGGVTPLGPANIWAPVTFSSATSAIMEWQRVTPVHPFGVPLVLVVGTLVWRWSRGPQRPDRSELLAVAALTGLALMAWRNVAPVTLMLVPLLAARLESSAVRPPRPVSRVVGRLSVAVVAAGVVAALALVATTDPLPDGSVPRRLVERVAALPGEQRVVNGYNEAGVVLWYSRDGDVRVAIDGRAERHGGDYISEYLAMLAMKPGWQRLFDRLSPTAALLPEDVPLASGLVAERGWREIDRQAGNVLLLPPG